MVSESVFSDRMVIIHFTKEKSDSIEQCIGIQSDAAVGEQLWGKSSRAHSPCSLLHYNAAQ